jgi:hypothetical protein
MSYNVELFANRFYFKATNYRGIAKLYYKSKNVFETDLENDDYNWEEVKPGKIIDDYKIQIKLGDNNCHVDCNIILDFKGYRVDFAFPEPVLEQLENGQEKIIMKMMEEYFDDKFGVGKAVSNDNKFIPLDSEAMRVQGEIYRIYGDRWYVGHFY